MVSEQDHNKGHSTQMARLRQSLSQVNESVCFMLMTHSQPCKVKDGDGGSVSWRWHIHLKFSQDIAVSVLNFIAFLPKNVQVRV